MVAKVFRSDIGNPKNSGVRRTRKFSKFFSLRPILTFHSLKEPPRRVHQPAKKIFRIRLIQLEKSRKKLVWIWGKNFWNPISGKKIFCENWGYGCKRCGIERGTKLPTVNIYESCLFHPQKPEKLSKLELSRVNCRQPVSLVSLVY